MVCVFFFVIESICSTVLRVAAAAVATVDPEPHFDTVTLFLRIFSFPFHKHIKAQQTHFFQWIPIASVKQIFRFFRSKFLFFTFTLTRVTHAISRFV